MAWDCTRSRRDGLAAALDPEQSMPCLSAALLPWQTLPSCCAQRRLLQNRAPLGQTLVSHLSTMVASCKLCTLPSRHVACCVAEAVMNLVNATLGAGALGLAG